jgi:hypothetical protein
MEKQDIEQIVASVRSFIKQVAITRKPMRDIALSKKRNYINGIDETYMDSIRMNERIRIHAELGTFPEHLFRDRSPRATPDEMKYLADNYKQSTLPVYLDFLSTVMRIYHDANYSLTYYDDPNDPNSFQRYVETQIPEFNSLETFMKSYLTHLKLTDAMGVVAVKPREIEIMESETGEYYVDDSKLTEPIPVFYPSERVLKYDSDDYLLVMSDEKSIVQTSSGNKERTGVVMELYDKQYIWRIEQTGKKDEYKFNIGIYFEHGLNKIPAIRMRGVPSLRNNELVWVSPFMYAVDLLDLVAINSAYLQVIINNCVFPYRVMYGDDCEYEYTDTNGQKSVCDMGYVFDSSLESRMICPQCAGTGLKSRINPFGVMLIRTGNSVNKGDREISQMPMSYVEPSIATPQFLMSKVNDDENKARRILHLNTSTTSVAGTDIMNPAANTATGMMTDLKALYAFVKPISDQLFEIWEHIMTWIGEMRYGDKFKKPILTYPTTFDFYTETDYMNNISMAVKSGMPPFVIQTILFKYLQSIFYNEKITANVFNLIYKTDRLITMTSNDVALNLGRGTVERYEAVLHDSALTFVQQLITEQPEFFDVTPFDEQQRQLIDIAKERATEIENEQQRMQSKGGMTDMQLVDTANAQQPMIPNTNMIA